MAKNTKLVIVGGGYVGVELAKALEREMTVTLIEPREAFVHAPAMLRGLVEPKVRSLALIPYDQLLSEGSVVQDRAEQIREDRVIGASGEAYAADFIVLCPGASNGGVFKPAGEGIASFRSAQSEVERRIHSAQRITIVGAGAVGVELAGEIAHSFPQKQIVLISSESELFADFPPALGQSLAAKLAELGVDLVLGQRVTDLQSTTEPYSGTVTLTDGRSIDADLVIPAVGSRPETELFEGLPGISKTSNGRIKVDSHLRPSDWPNVFAAGDVVDAGDGMTIVGASRQSPWLAKTLRARSVGKSLENIKAYTPWKSPPILVPLGPERGNSFLFFATFGDWVTKTMKGKDLFVSKYRKLLNQS